MSEDFKAPPLTDEQKEIFSDVHGGAANVALMSAMFDGHHVAVIVEHMEASNGDAILFPRAIIIDAAFMERFGEKLLNPDLEPARDLDSDGDYKYVHFDVNGINYRATYNQARDALLYEQGADNKWTLRGAFETIQRAKESVGWKFEDEPTFPEGESLHDLADDEPSLMEQFEVHDQLDALAGDASENGFEIGMRCGMCNMLMDHCRCPD